MTDRLDSPAMLERQLAALVAADPRLGTVRERAGLVAIRRIEPGFAGLVRTICGQQLSTASAAAIWTRYAALPGALDPAACAALSDEAIRAVGFSQGKLRTLRVLAAAASAGTLDLSAIEALPADEAIAALTNHPGIGPWTAEIYLSFAAGHPDIFPAGDLALQLAAQWAFALDARPRARELSALAARWAPHRSAAALLLWRYYAAIRGREGVMP